jgi:hypothetical protein
VRFVHLIPHSSVDCVRREVLADSILALNRLIASNSGIRRESASRRLSAIPTSYERLPLMQQAGESSRPATTSRCGSGPRRERRFRWAVFSASSRDQAKLLLILTSSLPRPSNPVIPRWFSTSSLTLGGLSGPSLLLSGCLPNHSRCSRLLSNPLSYSASHDRTVRLHDFGDNSTRLMFC